MIQKVFDNDIFRRAIKTFIQGMLAYLILQLQQAIEKGNIQVDKAFIESLVIGALAAGLSALMNYIVLLLNKEKEER